jgi:hypothetical protein
MTKRNIIMTPEEARSKIRGFWYDLSQDEKWELIGRIQRELGVHTKPSSFDTEHVIDWLRDL